MGCVFKMRDDQWTFRLVFLSLFLPSNCLLDLSSRHAFTFAQDNSYIELKPNWPLTLPRQISFEFRCLLPHTLLMYHGVSSSQPPINNYELSLHLENARLKFIHIFDTEHETITIGHALNNDRWHKVELSIDPLAGTVSIKLDEIFQEATLNSLQSNNSYAFINFSSVDSLLYFGGFNANIVWNRQYSYRRFVGCIREVVLHVERELVPYLFAVNYTQINTGCIDKCSLGSFCRYGGRCVNFYSHFVCDCFGSGHYDKTCSDMDLTTLTLRGYSYLSYKIYDWDDKVHSDYTRISITFRTLFDDSVLFYGGGEYPARNYIAAVLKNGSLVFSTNLGDGEIKAQLGVGLTDDSWHTFTVVHHSTYVSVSLDSEKKDLTVSGKLHYFHLDPLFYVGGIPDQLKKPDIHSKNNYIGTLREVYFNFVSILELLKYEVDEVDFHGHFPPDFGYKRVETVPLTFPFKKSSITVDQEKNDSLDIKLEFKTSLLNAVLAAGEVLGGGSNENGFWELRLKSGAVKLTLNVPYIGSEFILSNGHSNLSNNEWHNVSLHYRAEEIQLVVDARARKGNYLSSMRFGRRVQIAMSKAHPDLGFVGCMQKISIEGNLIDPRSILNDGHFQNEVTLDDCQLVDPCKRPHQCKHGGQCLVMNEKVLCNCTGTGYMGKTCHFSLYKRTCEELYLVGYRDQGVYMIDIDGNGPHPPAPVACEINPKTGVIMTRVDHNMQEREDVRGFDINSFYFDIVYRDFTPSMLRTLITHSKNCTQMISYSCHKAPLRMGTLTWFKSSYSNHSLNSLGVNKSGSCPCGETNSCDNTTKFCNCDIGDGIWRNDTVEVRSPQFLGITKMYFIRPRKLETDAFGVIKVGPLRCIEMDTQQYVITFRTSDSYLEVPGWRTGDLAFSFRTSNKQAILLYQQSYHLNNCFRVLLINETELLFEYTVEEKKRVLQISSQKPLNTGEWQQVWVDYDPHHVRFTINMDSKMIDLEKDEEFSPFDGPLYIGGAPSQFHSQSPVSDGLVGCFRGLVMNEEIVNIYYYLSARTPRVVQGCKPSCHPNPCKNQAICHEFWGSYTCECRNSLAHFGKHCEHNLNEDGITFVTGKANYAKLHADSQSQPPPFLTDDIILSIRTYIENGLIFYAHDHFNNFVQLHIQNGDELAFTFNSQRELMRGIVKFPELTRGQPVQILIDREPESTTIYANEHKTVINEPLYLIHKYRVYPWTEGEDLELVKPPRPPVEPKQYLQYFIGGIMKEYIDTQVNGFVGCISGLRVGLVNISLSKIVDMNPANIAYRKGCEMKCDTKPCKNGGYCIEDWKNKQRTCNCTFTSYIGSSCNEERSGMFRGQTLIKYKFHPFSIYLTVELKIAFVTSPVPPRPSILMFVNSKVDERNYIYITLLPDGKLKFEEDDGTGKIIRMITEKEGGSFGDGQRHWLYYVRHDDNVYIYVDGVKIEPEITITDNVPEPENIAPDQNASDHGVRYGGDEDRDVVILGGIDFKDNRFADHINFTGCLSTVMVKIDDFNISPLETAFGYNAGQERLLVEGSLQQVQVCPAMFQDIKSTTPSPLNLTLYAGPKWKPPELLKTPYNPPAPPRYDFAAAEASTRRVGLAMGIFLIVLFTGIGIYLWRIDWKDKEYRYESGLSKKEQTLQERKNQSQNGIAKVSFRKRPNNNTRIHIREAVPLQESSNAVEQNSLPEMEWDPSADQNLMWSRPVGTSLVNANNKQLSHS